MKKHLVMTAALLATGLVSGCGSSGSGNTMTNQTSAEKSVVSGAVADGYLVNATVFLDKNGNYRLDAGEPSTSTIAKGVYSLTVDFADVGKYPIVALATKGVTIDEDTNQAVASSYVLSLPKDSVSGTVNSNFISPITTQVREMMETGTYSSMQQAMEDLRTKMGLPGGTNVMSDYMAANNTAIHAAARNMASLMGSQMSQVLPGSGSNTTVDVNRYRGMMGTIFSNISSVKIPNAPMTNLMGTMATALSNVPASGTGQPYKNMSTAFRGTMGGMNTKMGGMMGK